MVDRERVTKAAEALRNYRRSDEEKYFEELLCCYGPLIKKLTRNLYYLEREDCEQELSTALYIAAKRIVSMKNDSQCTAYLARALRYAFYKLYQQSAVAKRIQERKIVFEMTNNTENGKSEIDETLFRMELEEQLAKISEKQAEILREIVLGYCDQEIADNLHCSRQYVNRVKKRLSPDKW